MARINQPAGNVKYTNVSVVRLTIGKDAFELACYPNKLEDWRAGRETDIWRVLQTDNIFSSVRRGLVASQRELELAFGHADRERCIATILDRGDLQLSHLERKRRRDEYVAEVCRLIREQIYNRATRSSLTTTQLDALLHATRLYPRYCTTNSPKSLAKKIIFKLAKARSAELMIPSLKVELDFGFNPDAAAATNSAFESTVHSTVQVFGYEFNSTTIRFWCLAGDAPAITSFIDTLPHLVSKPDLERIVPLDQKFIDGVIENMRQPRTASVLCKQIISNTDANNSDGFEENKLGESEAINTSDTDDEINEQEFLTLPSREQNRLRKQRLKKQLRAEAKRQLEQEEITANSEQNQEPEEPSSAPPTDKARVDEFSNAGTRSSGSDIYCETCREYVSDCRRHCKSDWHVYNLHRKLNNCHPVSSQFFEETCRDLIENVLDLESD